MDSSTSPLNANPKQPTDNTSDSDDTAELRESLVRGSLIHDGSTINCSDLTFEPISDAFLQQVRSVDDDTDSDDTKDNKDDKQDEESEQSLTNNIEDEDLGDDIDQAEKESIKELAEDESFSQPKSYGSILAEEFVHARATFKRSYGSLFTSAFIAGLEIGISFIMLITVYAILSDLIPSQYAITLASLLYPIGFITVVIGQSILYTEQTSLLSLPVVAGIETVAKLAKLWGIVIIGNVIGGCVFSLFMVWLGLNMGWFEVVDINFLTHHVLDYPWWILLGSSIVAGWMMGLAAWLATSARDTLSRVVLVALITACIGVLGLHHSIVGNIEIFSGLIFGDTRFVDYIWFLLLALLGNTIGGVVFVTVLKFGSLKYDINKLKEDRLDELRNTWPGYNSEDK